MIEFETLFPRVAVAARLRQGLFGPYLNDLAADLTQRRYSTNTIRRSLCAADRFGDWLSAQGLSLGDAQTAIARYLDERGRGSSGKRPHITQGLHHIVRILRQKGLVSTTPAGAPELTLTEQWLLGFEQYRREVAGSAASTSKRYRPILRRFLSERFGAGPLDWAALTADELTKFARQEASARKNFGRKMPGTALRVMLRYLVSSGEVRKGIEGAIPAIRQWKHAALPPQLTEQQLTAVLGSCQKETAAGLRDRAVLLLLARLGMRAKEVAQLSIEEVDWHGGRLVLRAGKTHCQRVLPLSDEVGQALAAYLTRGRPEGKSRVIFLRSLPPFEPLEGASAVSRIARRRLLETGYPAGPRVGAHLFRHTVASRMVCRGATFKDVADVLGHRSLETTGIYAKLDLATLSQVALPCSGGAQ